jgi:hypothetical protein
VGDRICLHVAVGLVECQHRSFATFLLPSQSLPNILTMTQENHEKGVDNICLHCREIDVEKLLLGRDYLGPIQLRGYQEILQQDDCALCRVFIRALSFSSQSFWQKGHYPIEICHLGRIQGTSSPPRLEVWFDATSSTLPIGVHGHMTTVGEILPMEELPNDENITPRGLARLLSNSAADFSLIQNWINYCRDNHESNCHGLPRKCVDMMLIDVERMRVTRCDSSLRYVCLSYVWGNVKAFHTTKSSLPDLEKEGSLVPLGNRLPRTIRDAITLVSTIGERYLWVDSVCIVQDDNTNKRKQISQMGEIYSQAELTIVALSGSDAGAGLPGVMESSRYVQQLPETVKGLRLTAKLPELSSTLSDSKWDTRAWTFQEKVLSRRCLFLSDTQSYFQCRTSYHTEDCIREQNRTSPAAGDSNPFERQVIENDGPYGTKFFIYESLVKSYSCRKISYHSDSLHAFVGILSSFKRSFGWTFISSLPESVFDLALLWRPMATISLRPRNVPKLACTSPTWCWTSWIGNIYWDAWCIHSYAGATVSLKSEVHRFVFKAGNCIHRIVRHLESLDPSEAYDELESEARAYISETSNSCSDLAIGPEAISDMCLFFKVSAADMSQFSISSNMNHSNTDDAAISDWLRWQFRTQIQIYDSKGLRCGNLHGIDSVLENSYDSSLCEFILLSRCNQKEISQTDVSKYQDSLPLEYPSSREYYEQTFDTNSYQYKSGGLSTSCSSNGKDLSQGGWLLGRSMSMLGNVCKAIRNSLRLFKSIVPG